MAKKSIKPSEDVKDLGALPEKAPEVSAPSPEPVAVEPQKNLLVGKVHGGVEIIASTLSEDGSRHSFTDARGSKFSYTAEEVQMFVKSASEAK